VRVSFGPFNAAPVKIGLLITKMNPPLSARRAKQSGGTLPSRRFAESLLSGRAI
jgi:hypothetical protein